VASLTLPERDRLRHFAHRAGFRIRMTSAGDAWKVERPKPDKYADGLAWLGWLVPRRTI
jgi:hypothetical protein